MPVLCGVARACIVVVLKNAIVTPSEIPTELHTVHPVGHSRFSLIGFGEILVCVLFQVLSLLAGENAFIHQLIQKRIDRLRVAGLIQDSRHQDTSCEGRPTERFSSHSLCIDCAFNVVERAQTNCRVLREKVAIVTIMLQLEEGSLLIARRWLPGIRLFLLRG